MKNSFLAVAVLLMLSSLAMAESYLQVSDAWVRQPPPGASAAAAYLTITNPSDTEYYITGASSSRFGAVELHESVEDNGMARMIHHNFYRVPAKGVFEARPGSYHLMLFRWNEVLQEGETVDFTLQQGNGETVSFQAVVKKP